MVTVRVGIVLVIFVQVEVVRGGNCSGWKLSGGSCLGWKLSSGSCPSRSCPRTNTAIDNMYSKSSYHVAYCSGYEDIDYSSYHLTNHRNVVFDAF